MALLKIEDGDGRVKVPLPAFGLTSTTGQLHMHLHSGMWLSDACLSFYFCALPFLDLCDVSWRVQDDSHVMFSGVAVLVSVRCFDATMVVARRLKDHTSPVNRF